MFKKTMKFDDLDGNPVEQTFYFNYNKLEIAELIQFGCVLEFKDPKREYLPLEELMEKLNTPTEESGLTEQENTQQAYNIFLDLLLDAFGKKGADNVSFDKSWELRNYWRRHVAFPELIFEFIGDTKLANAFIEQCLPPRMVAEAKEEIKRKNPGRYTDEMLHEMVLEADKRQQDPETRIEPGIDAAREALGESPAVEQLAGAVKVMDEDGPKPVSPRGEEPDETVTTREQVLDKKQEDLVADDIALLTDEEVKKLDPRRLRPDTLAAAFIRKAG